MTTSGSPPDRDVAAVIAQDKRARRKRRIFWIVGILLVLAGAWVLIGDVSGDGGAAQNFETMAAKRGTLQQTVIATGRLRPTNQVDVGSEISGRIEEVRVDFNEPVEKGQILAVLDTDQLEARVAERKAQLAAAKAALKQAEATVREERAKARRARQLVEKEFTSEQTLESAVAAAERAEAAVTSAEAQVVVAEAALDADLTTLKKAVIRSPIDGIVISREVEAGQTLAANFQTPVLFKLAEDLTRMALHLDVDEADIGLVYPGQKAFFTVDAYPERRFPAEIASVRYAPQEEDNVVTYEAVLTVANDDLLLRPGMTATAEIIADSKPDVVMVPNRALRFTPPREGFGGTVAGLNAEWNTDDAARVWVLKDGTPEAIPVETGAANEEWTEVTKGDVTPGTALVIGVARGNGR